MCASLNTLLLTSLQEAIDLLSRANGEGRPLAGGTDLIAQMKENRKSPALVVDVKRIPELNVLSLRRKAGAAGRRGGFLHPHRQLSAGARALSCAGRGLRLDRLGPDSEPCGGWRQLLQCYAFGRYGAADPFLRGKSSYRRPQWPPRVAGGEFFCRARDRPCSARAKSWSRSPFQRRLAHSGAAYLRFIPREEMDIAVAGVGSFVQFSADGRRCEQARITLAAVAPTPVRAREAEEFLVGKTPDQATFAQAGELAARAAQADLRCARLGCLSH